MYIFNPHAKEKEIRARLCFKDFLNQNNKHEITTTYTDPAGFDPFDVAINSANTVNALVEIKVRPSYSMFYFAKEGAMIEKTKYDSLKSLTEYWSRKKQKQIKPLYAFFCKDGMIIYNLPDLNPEDFKIENQRDNNDPNCTSKSNRLMYYIPKEYILEAIQYKIDYKKIEEQAKNV